MESPNASGPEPEPDLMDGLPDADLLLAIEDHQAQSSSVVPVAEPQKKKRAFKRKPAQLPDDYKKLKEIPKVDKEKHSKRWLKAQEVNEHLWALFEHLSCYKYHFSIYYFRCGEGLFVLNGKTRP